MLSALASGQLVRDPKSGTSASGTRWANTTIRVSTGNDREGNALASFVTILAFNDDADRLAKLGKGDAISVQGSLKQTQYEANGETRHGLEILVNGILSVHDKRKRASGNGNDRHPHAPGQERGRQSHDYPFDDAPGF
jgi:single-stranded DNA-binding protein